MKFKFKKKGARMALERKTPKSWTRVRKVFPCPKCEVLLCSRGRTKVAENAVRHFSAKHTKFNARRDCLACATQNVSENHRIQCLYAKNAEMKTRKTLTADPQRDSDTFRGKRDHTRIKTKLGRDLLSFRPYKKPTPEEARLVEHLEPPHSNFEPSLNHGGVREAFEKSSTIDYERFREYLEHCFEKADPETDIGIAIKTLLSYENGKFHHLMVTHEHLPAFIRLTKRHPEVIQPTQFFCFCNTRCRRRRRRRRSIHYTLHMHLLARIANLKEFDKKIWKTLKSKDGQKYKKRLGIESFFHFFNAIFYVSQQVDCRLRGDDGPMAEEEEEEEPMEEEEEEEKLLEPIANNEQQQPKHFMMAVKLTPADKLNMMTVVPPLILRYIRCFCKIHHLQHFDIHRGRNNDCYYSTLGDVVRQMDTFDHRVNNHVVLGEDGQVHELEEAIKADEHSIRCMGETLPIIWSREAKNYCATLFQVTSVPKREESDTFRVKYYDNGQLEFANEHTHTDNVLHALGIMYATLESKNVRLEGTKNDVKTFKDSINGFYTGDQHSFGVVWKNLLFPVYYKLTDEDNEERKSSYFSFHGISENIFS